LRQRGLSIVEIYDFVSSNFSRFGYRSSVLTLTPLGGLTIIAIYVLFVIENLALWSSQQWIDLPGGSTPIKAAAQQLPSSLSLLILDFADVICHRGRVEHCRIEYS